MSEKNIQLEIITPTQKVYGGTADSFAAPGMEGYFGVLPGHAPYVVALGIGEIRLKNNDSTTCFSTSGGFAEVLPGKVTVLANSVESTDAIDVDRAKDAAARAQQRITEGRKKWDIDRAQIALARALNRIKLANK